MEIGQAADRTCGSRTNRVSDAGSGARSGQGSGSVTPVFRSGPTQQRPKVQRVEGVERNV